MFLLSVVVKAIYISVIIVLSSGHSGRYFRYTDEAGNTILPSSGKFQELEETSRASSNFFFLIPGT